MSFNPFPYIEGAQKASKNYGENRSMDDILRQSRQAENSQGQDDIMAQVLQRLPPEKRPEAMQYIQNKKAQQQSQELKAKQGQALQTQGLDPSIANLDPALQKEIVKNKMGTGKINPEVQKWAYKELEKKPAIQSLNNSIKELRRLNESGVTGPLSGNVPAWLANSESDAIRKAIDTEAIQILNVHKSMFPRGLTQGEFNTLSKKLVSSKNTQQANDAILNTYERLGKLQEQKLQAVQDATEKYGFDPMLPFIVSGIQKEFDDQEEKENRHLYDTVMNSGKEKPKESSNKMIKLRHAATGQMAEVPEEKYLSLSEEQRKIYERL
jgi:hypothetical protein